MARMFIAGESVASLTGETYDVRNPADGEVVVGTVDTARLHDHARHCDYRPTREVLRDVAARPSSRQRLRRVLRLMPSRRAARS